MQVPRALVSRYPHPEESAVAACENLVFRPTGRSRDRFLPLDELSSAASVSALRSRTRAPAV